MTEMTRQLTALFTRELVRDKRYFIFAFLFPFGMMGIFLLIDAAMPKDESAPDFSQMVIPMAIFLAVTGTALTVTAHSLAGMRSSGILRLLGTTPVGRRRLILAHMIPRVGMLTVQMMLLLMIGAAIGVVALSTIPGLFGASLMGLSLFMSIGYVIGGRLSSPDAAANISTLVQISTLFLSGLAFPLWLMPHTVATALSWIPTSFFADLLMHLMPEGRPRHEIWLSCTMLMLTSTILVFLTMRTFRWDQSE